MSCGYLSEMVKFTEVYAAVFWMSLAFTLWILWTVRAISTCTVQRCVYRRNADRTARQFIRQIKNISPFVPQKSGLIRFFRAVWGIVSTQALGTDAVTELNTQVVVEKRLQAVPALH